MRRDPRTGRMVSEDDFLLATNRQQAFVPGPDLPEEGPKEPEAPFVPIRVWTAGRGMPQQKIFVQGEPGLRPGHDGAYNVVTKRQYDALKRALGPQFWTDDVPEGEPSPKCDTCGWSTRSYKALIAHNNNAHGRPQASR